MVLASWLSKVILGGSLLVAGTGLSVGSVLLVTKNSSPEGSVSTKEQHTNNKVESEEVDVASQEPEERKTDDTAGKANSVSGDTSSTGGDQNEMTSESDGGQELVEEEKIKPRPKHGKCTIYKIERSSPLTIKEAGIDFLKQEKAKKTKSYKKIEEECNKGEDIFVTNKYVGWYREWGYHEQKDEYKQYVKKNLKMGS